MVGFPHRIVWKRNFGLRRSFTFNHVRMTTFRPSIMSQLPKHAYKHLDLLCRDHFRGRHFTLINRFNLTVKAIASGWHFVSDISRFSPGTCIQTCPRVKPISQTDWDPDLYLHLHNNVSQGEKEQELPPTWRKQRHNHITIQGLPYSIERSLNNRIC